MNRVIQAPEYVRECGPVIFLAGPINWGSESWQAEAVRLLRELGGEFDIATPRREVPTMEEFSEDDYAEQVDWETHHLRLAGRGGVVLFWLAREAKHRCARPHAQTTRFELGEWKERHAREGAKLVVGIDEGFTGGRYIRRRMRQDCPGVRICSSLRETCEAAAGELELARAGSRGRSQGTESPFQRV